MKRRSEAGLPSTGDEFNLKLFEHALKDPITKNAVLKLLTSQNKSVFELFNNNSLNNVTKSPVRKLKKRDHCESPTALLRRRELEKINRPESAQSNSSEQSSSSKNSALNFENILNGVKVYVEINSNGNDRSAGAKALLRSMGAIVRDQFTRDVTHVIFKDGSYQTYQRAKLLKVHFVSVLWLEASRRNGVRVPEKDYPALGTKNYDKNISLICSQIQKDYEDVIREEVRHSLQSGFPLPSTKSLLENRRKTIASTSKLFDTSTNSINSGPCEEMESILSKFREQSQQSEASSKIYSVHNVDEDLLNLSKTIEDRLNSNSTNSFESSNSILGRKNSNILVSDSDCSMANRCLSRSSGKSVILEDSFDAVTPVEPLDVMSSNMEITCSNDSDNSDSMSLISRRQTPKRKSKNITTNMDLTNLNAETSCQRNDISEGNTGSILNSIKGSILNSISYFTKTPILDERNSKKQKLDNKENCNLLTSDDDVNEADLIYNCKTPKLKNIKEKQIPSEKYLGRKLIINSEEQVGNVAKSSMTPLRTSTSSEKARIPSENEKNSPNVSSSRIPDSTEGVRNSKGNKTISTDAPSSRMSNNSNKERTTTGNKTGSKGSLRLSDKDRNSKENEIISVAMSPLQISNKSNEEGNSKENKTNSIDMSSLRISDKGETSRENKTGSTDMSSLRISENKSGSENISPLHITTVSEKLFMDGTTSSSSSKMSSLQISADEKIDGNEPKEIERSGTNISINKVNDVAEKVTTPFVTERKRKNCSKSEASELKKSLISRRESLALKKEQNKFEMDLKLRKEFHDKNKEIELGCNKVKNNGDTKKSLKFDVIASPFVNTRPRRVSSKNVVQEGSNSNSERRKSTMIGTKISRNQLTEKEKEIDEITENMPLNPELLRTEKTAKNGDLKVFPGKEKSNEQTSRTRTSNKVSDKTYEIKTPVVLLENILISPQKNSVDTNQSIRKSRRKTLLESDKGTAVSSISTLKENEELSTGNSDEKTECAKFEPKESSKKVTKSISDKTIDTIRRSRRIRKLYNPEDAVINPDIQQEISVDDDEEREKIRKEKVMKINSVAEGVFLSGNVLLTQKALEYLEKNRNNQNVISTLYKSPESLLDDLGIERKKKIEKKKESFMDISGIEPIKLGEEFVHKKPKGPSQSQSGGFKTPTTRKSTRILTSKFATTEKKRRSTLEFEPNSLRVPKIKTMLKLDQKPTIVCTKMHKPDVQMFNQIVKKLGAFEVEDEVSSRTTHLVVGEVKRTINMLRALARGCWILKQEWLLSSLEQRKWLSEEDYEVTEFSPAVQKCRLERSAFGPSYTMNIFLNCGLIYVAKSTTPRCSDLRELIGLCKGKLSKIPDNAAIVVGSYFEDCKCVTEHWILDSISAGKLKPMKKYLISNTIKSPFV